jgi:adenylate kinase
VRNRLTVYQKQTAPLLDWYTGKGLLVSVQGAGSIADIGRRVQHATRRPQ